MLSLTKLFRLLLLVLPLLPLTACPSKDSDPKPSIPAPTVTALTPATGSAGVTVTITGTQFTGATAVSFNGTTATSFTVTSATSLTATVPAGATTGPVSVTTPGGTAASPTPFTVTGSPLTIACADITSNTTWTDRLPGSAVDYVVNCPINITGSAVLTIEPGVVIEFGSTSACLATQDNAGLSIKGISGDPVYLQGVRQAAGLWKGVLFGSNNPANELSYVVVEGGGGAPSTATNQLAAVQLTRTDSRASIRSTTIRYSGGAGVWVADRANLTAFDNVALRYTNGPYVSLPLPMAGKMAANCSFPSAADAHIAVRGTTATSFVLQLEAPATLARYLDAPYRFSGTCYLKSLLTVQPGAVLEFETGASLTTMGNLYETTGGLNATGTAANHITFRGVQRAPGAWKGLAFCSPNPSNRLIYCDISDGGADRIWGSEGPATLKANVAVGSNSRSVQATVQNCTISNSLGFGLARRNLPVVTLTQAANTFNTNASGDQTTW